MYTVTRQCRRLRALKLDLVVVVSEGSREDVNPDSLMRRYPGEFEEFTDPREVVEAAIRIIKAWGRNVAERVYLGISATGLETSLIPVSEFTYGTAREWARRVYHNGSCSKSELEAEEKRRRERRREREKRLKESSSVQRDKLELEAEEKRRSHLARIFDALYGERGKDYIPLTREEREKRLRKAGLIW